jgi:hypothetical protein
MKGSGWGVCGGGRDFPVKNEGAGVIFPRWSHGDVRFPDRFKLRRAVRLALVAKDFRGELEVLGRAIKVPVSGPGGKDDGFEGGASGGIDGREEGHGEQSRSEAEEDSVRGAENSGHERGSFREPGIGSREIVESPFALRR